MDWFRFVDVMNNKTIINIFNSDKSNISKTMKRYKIMTAIANKILKFIPINNMNSNKQSLLCFNICFHKKERNQ